MEKVDQLLGKNVDAQLFEGQGIFVAGMRSMLDSVDSLSEPGPEKSSTLAFLEIISCLCHNPSDEMLSADLPSATGTEAIYWALLKAIALPGIRGLEALASLRLL